MESIDESLENSQEKVEPIHLFENSWFFNNLFITNKRTPPPIIPRCFSDPCPSFSNHHHHHQAEISPPPPPGDKSMEEAFLAIKKLPTEGGGGAGGGRFSRPAGLTRAPSLPEESAPQRVRKSNLQRSFAPNNSNQIARAPSLPSSTMIRDEIHDDESDFSMSRLIRQASLQHSDLLPPRSSSTKGVGATRSPSTPKQRQRTKPADIENSTTTKRSSSGSGSGEGGVSHSAGSGDGVGGGVGVRRQHQQQQQHQYGFNNRTRLARSTSDMGFQELVGFRELNYVENKTKEEEQQQASTSSSSTKWHEQNNSTSPTTQQRITEQWEADKRRSVEDDMKAQIKFWARTVASNVK